MDTNNISLSHAIRDRWINRELGKIERPTSLQANLYQGNHCFCTLRIKASTMDETRARWEAKAAELGMVDFSIYFSTGPEVNGGHSPYVIRRTMPAIVQRVHGMADALERENECIRRAIAKTKAEIASKSHTLWLTQSSTQKK